MAANVTNRTGVRPDDVALVYGAGPVGLMVLQVLKGVHGIRVLVADRIDERLVRATACGADAVVNTASEPLPEALRRLGVEDGPTLRHRRGVPPEHPRGGRAPGGARRPHRDARLLGGALGDRPAGDDAQGAVALRLAPQLRGCFPRVIEWMKAGRLEPERIVSHRVPFAEVQQAFALVEGDPRATSKVLLDFAPGA